jgi:hypothetical protein
MTLAAWSARASAGTRLRGAGSSARSHGRSDAGPGHCENAKPQVADVAARAEAKAIIERWKSSCPPAVTCCGRAPQLCLVHGCRPLRPAAPASWSAGSTGGGPRGCGWNSAIGSVVLLGFKRSVAALPARLAVDVVVRAFIRGLTAVRHTRRRFNLQPYSRPLRPLLVRSGAGAITSVTPARTGHRDYWAILLDAGRPQAGEAVTINRTLPGEKFLDRQHIASAGFFE